MSRLSKENIVNTCSSIFRNKLIVGKFKTDRETKCKRHAWTGVENASKNAVVTCLE
jgi:hypothetical protein